MNPTLGRDTKVVVSFSGGKDSTAMLLYLCSEFPGLEIDVVFADTGWEHPETWEWICQLVGEIGKVYSETTLNLHKVQSDTKDFLSMVEKRGMFPSAQYRQCTSDLKRAPIYKWIRNNCKEGKVIQCIGLRADESAARAKKNPLTVNQTLTIKTREVTDWLPIHDWGDRKVRTYITNRGFRLHPVYQYLSRFSCRVCIFASARELAAIHQHDAEAIAIIHFLEEKIGFTMSPEGPIAQRIADFNQGEELAYNEPPF